MNILSWNVNGLQTRWNSVNQLVIDLQPDLICFQKVRKKDAFFTQISSHMGWLSTMEKGR